MRTAYQEEKMNSDANLAKYYAEIEFGPEFICICCHASLDENQVLEFTDERKEKIMFTTSVLVVLIRLCWDEEHVCT